MGLVERTFFDPATAGTLIFSGFDLINQDFTALFTKFRAHRADTPFPRAGTYGFAASGSARK